MLGIMSDATQECDCRKRKCVAKILYADGREIPKGLLRLSVDGGRGQFVPSEATNLPQTMETQVTAVVGQGKYSHQHLLRKWKYCPDTLIGGADGPFVGFFEFESDANGRKET